MIQISWDECNGTLKFSVLFLGTASHVNEVMAFPGDGHGPVKQKEWQRAKNGQITVFNLRNIKSFYF
jgi:hypothetical protein